ncbi:hypothetical protein PERCYII10_1646 [Pseudomonas aeruginosa]|nr:hypothetical protein PERCYII10_1646 [Pseudomonas aeruginosa]
MGIPHGFFHFMSSEGRNGGWPRGERSPRSPFPGPRRAASRASQRNRDGRPATY